MTFLEALIAENNETFHRAFLDSLLETDLKPLSLFSWDVDIQNRTFQALEKIINYGRLLQKDKRSDVSNKGKLAVLLGQQLLEKGKAISKEDNPLDENKKFKNLLYKLEVLSILHKEDHTFAIHKGWKRFLDTLGPILFPLQNTNLSQTSRAQHELFFNQASKVQAMVDKEDEQKSPLASPCLL